MCVCMYVYVCICMCMCVCMYVEDTWNLTFARALLISDLTIYLYVVFISDDNFLLITIIWSTFFCFMSEGNYSYSYMFPKIAHKSVYYAHIGCFIHHKWKYTPESNWKVHTN